MHPSALVQLGVDGRWERDVRRIRVVTFLILLLFAVIFVVAGGVLLYFRNKNKQKAALMGQTETSRASEVSASPPALSSR
jgi:heme/copper-type cytochrome/quinol oxidase subunit 2